MTNLGNVRLTATVPRTASGALDHTALEVRARELRREAVGALFDALAHWVACARARAANWLAAKPLPDGCTRC